MTKCVLDALNIFIKTLPLKEPIYEIGSRILEGLEDIANIRPLFPNKKYVGCDIVAGPGVDRILDGERMGTINENEIGTIICLETIEHMKHPYVFFKEAARCLHPEGFLLVSSVMLYTIHGAPRDYWRFTPYGLSQLFSEYFPKFRFLDF